MDSSDLDNLSARSRSSTRLPAASSGGQTRSRFRSSSRQAGTRRAPSSEPQSLLAGNARPPSAVRAPSPATRGRMLQPHKQHLLHPHKTAAQVNSRIPYRHPTPPLPGTGPMQEQAVKASSQLPRNTPPSMQPPQSPARPPHTPLLPRMFSPSDPYLQGSKGLHERGLAALKEYRRLREERIQQAIRARQQQQIPQSSNGHLRYTIQQPPFLAGRPRTSSQPPNHHQATPTRGSSRGRSGASQSPLSAAATRSPFSADRPRTSRRGSSVCSERRGLLTAAQRSGSGAVSNSSNTPPHHGAHGDPHAAANAISSPAMQVSKGPVLKITPKVIPKLKTRTGDPRTDSQMHAEGSILQPQSPPSLRLQDQRTVSTLDSGGGPGVAGGMEDLLLQQVTSLLAEKSNWTSEKQRLEKEVEQLHELIEYLFEQFNIPMDDSSVPLDGLTGLPQYLPGNASDGNMPSNGSIPIVASSELPPLMGGGCSASAQGWDSMGAMHGAHAPGQCNGNVIYHNSADLPSANRGNHSSADLSPHASRASPKQASSSHALSGSVVEDVSRPGDVTLDVSVPESGPVAESDASFINMLCDGMTMMSASDTPHASNLAADNSPSAAAFPLVVDGPRR